MKNQKWLVSEIAGSEVYDVSGEKLGVLANVLPTNSNDIWVINGKGGELLIPALKTVVKEVDTALKRITVDLPKGLREIYETAPKEPGGTDGYED